MTKSVSAVFNGNGCYINDIVQQKDGWCHQIISP